MRSTTLGYCIPVINKRRSLPALDIFLQLLNMDSRRAAAIAATLRAYEAWSLVEAHHPRGLAPFAVDAYIECSTLNAVLNDSEYACRGLRPLAFPGDGLEDAATMPVRRRYQNMRRAQVATRLAFRVADQRLFELTRSMEADEFIELGYAVNRHLRGR